MTKARFLFPVLLVCTMAVQAQTTDALIGKWKFKDIFNAEKIDSSSLKMLRTMFADVSMYFNANKHYKVNMMKKEEGEWSYNETTKKLTMAANKGTESQLEIISLSGNTLIASIGKNKSFILEKATPTAADEVEEPIVKVNLMSATPTQLCKKWFLTKRDVPGRTAEESKIVTDLADGTYFNFKPDNTYETQVFKIKSDGTWKFGPGNKSLLLTIERTTITWKIKSISENELVLMKGNTTETWTLSAKH